MKDSRIVALFALTLVCGAVSRQTPEPACPDCGNPNCEENYPGVECPWDAGADHSTYFPVEGHCDQFIQCANGCPVKFDCPAGLYFNPKLDVCDWPYNVDCGDCSSTPPPCDTSTTPPPCETSTTPCPPSTTTECPTTTTECPTTSTECSTTTTECPTTTTECPTTTTECPTTTTECPTTTTECPTTTTECPTTTTECPTTTTECPTTTTECPTTTSTPCPCQTSTTPSPPTTQPCTEPAPPCDRPVCPPNDFNVDCPWDAGADHATYFPVEGRCDQFIECANGCPVLFDCPSGLFWNTKVDVCDWPYNVDCKDCDSDKR